MEGLLAGRRGVIFGVANDRSIAWACAKSCAAHGAKLIFNFLGDAQEKRVRKLLEGLPGALCFPCDLRSDDEIAAFFENVRKEWGALDFIIHSVAYAEREDLKGRFVDTARANFALAIDISAYSLVAVARAAREAGVSRLIYSSSCSVYGSGGDTWLDEESQPSPVSLYARAKIRAEAVLLEMAGPKFCVTVLRNATVYGVSPRMRFDLIVNTMYKTAMQEKKITINNPAIWRPILGMRDAVNAYLRAIQADESISGVFNLASSNFTVGQVGDLVWAHMAQEHGMKVQLDLRNIQDYRNYKVSNQKAKDVLGVTFNDSIDSILESLDAHFGPDFDYDQDEFNNIKVFHKIFPKIANSR